MGIEMYIFKILNRVRNERNKCTLSFQHEKM